MNNENNQSLAPNGEIFIVAEVSKNWTPDTPPADLLSNRFEMIINVNKQRGYKLIDWKIDRIVIEGCLNETIIAIFEKENNG
jgi:hypothetical protein